MEEFKVGDEIIIKSQPQLWSSMLSQNSPFNHNAEITYPFRCKIEQERNEPGNHHAIAAGDYGWSLDCLKRDGLIELVKPIFEPLPQFQIVKTIDGSLMTIVECINNEGSTFEIGDNVISLGLTATIVRKIISFRHNKARTDICAVFQGLPNGISISKLQHYIKPKVVEIPVEIAETNLEKAIRLYPIGTRFRPLNAGMIICTIQSINLKQKENGRIWEVLNQNSNVESPREIKQSNGAYHYLYDNRGNWAEIIND